MNLRTFFNPENWLADENELFPCPPRASAAVNMFSISSISEFHTRGEVSIFQKFLKFNNFRGGRGGGGQAYLGIFPFFFSDAINLMQGIKYGRGY